MERNLEMLRYLGYKREFSGKAELWISKQDLSVAEEVRNKFHNIPYAIIFPGAGHSMRVWMAENYIQTISCIFTEWPMCWLICGSTSELDMCQEIQKSLTSFSIPSENYAGKTSLREMYGLLKGASMYLGNDTMAAHLAAAAEVPSVCILGGAYYGRFYPYPDNPRTVSVSVELPCQGCNWECSRDEAECIISIPVEKVVHAAKNLLQSCYANHDFLAKKRNI
jgi:ADP-heptose:LPS heptosyltransferase